MQIRKTILSEANAWRKINARYPGKCVLCQGEIMQGDAIENNSEQRINRHEKCAKELYEKENLKNEIIKFFIIGNNEKAIKYYEKMIEIEANNIIKNYELKNESIPLKRNDEKIKEFKLKIKNDVKNYKQDKYSNYKSFFNSKSIQRKVYTQGPIFKK